MSLLRTDWRRYVPLDRQKRPAFTSECLTCNVLGRAPNNKAECAEHDHSLSDDAADHIKALINLALDRYMGCVDSVLERV